MPPIFKKIIFVLFIIIFSSSIFFGYNYAIKNLKGHLLAFLDENLNVKFSIGHVGIYLPLCLELKDVKIDDSVDVRSIRIYPRLVPFLLKNNFIVSTVKMINPVARLKKGEKGELVNLRFLKKNEGPSNAPLPNLCFSKIYIHNGTLIYDTGDGNKLEFVGIKGKIENPGVYFLKGDTLQFAAAGFIKNKDSDFLSPFLIDGVLGGRSGLKTRLQASDVKLDTFGIVYTKYLSSFIREGRVDLKSDIKVSNNLLIAKCFLEGENFMLKNDQDKKLAMPIAASFILLLNFRNNLVKIKNLRSNFFQLLHR